MLKHSLFSLAVVAMLVEGVYNTITPRLCNRLGVPYGFARARVEITKRATGMKPIVQQDDPGCPAL